MVPADVDTWLAGSHAPSRSGGITQNPGTFCLVTIDAVRSSRQLCRTGHRVVVCPIWSNAEAILTSLDLGSSAVCRRGRSARAQSRQRPYVDPRSASALLNDHACVRPRLTEPERGRGARPRIGCGRQAAPHRADKNRPERASKVGRGGSRAPTMSAVVARNILDGILYVDKF